MTEQEKKREYNRRRHEEALPAYEALMSCYPFTLDNLDGEIWRDIEGLEDYQVSTFGRIKSFKRCRAGKILTPQLSADYLEASLHKDGNPHFRRIHILVAQAFIPNPENKPEVNHKIGMKFNCHVSNLEWATTAENNQHAYNVGLKFSAQGIEDSNAKIKDEKDIVYIRDNPDNLTTYELAAMFGMSKAQISKIQTGKTYKEAGGTIRKPKKYTPPLSDEIKQKILVDWATGNFTRKQLAEKYSLARSTINRILRGN
ncbi:MAG: NUMOD4 motif-containing HNH endonuclease [Selenomonadaceae bacterium]|nr:NUMOD4 motif-containing HNH endonuclease [Selenomonadaceae bacterium]